LRADEQYVRSKLMPGDDVGLLDQVGVKDGPRLPRPLFQLGQLVDQKDTGPLRLATGLHDPMYA
jgi:hypothetical protein